MITTENWSNLVGFSFVSYKSGIRKSNSLSLLTLCSVLAQAGAPPIFPPVAIPLGDGGHGRQQPQHPQLHVLKQNGQFTSLTFVSTEGSESGARALTGSAVKL